MKINNLEIKVATYCTLALLAGLIIVSCLGCATTTESKVHVGEKTYSAEKKKKMTDDEKKQPSVTRAINRMCHVRKQKHLKFKIHHFQTNFDKILKQIKCWSKS